MAITDSFSNSTADSSLLKSITNSVSAGFAEGKAGIVRDEIAQIKRFYTNTLALQKQLQKATGQELPIQIQSMMKSAISGFDSILDQKVSVSSDQAQATLALVDKIADAKMGSEVVPVMTQLKKISDRQNLQTIANQNAQERMQLTSMALGQSMTSFVSENIDAVSNSDLGQELAQSLPVALAGPFAPLVSAVDDLVDFRGVGGKLKQGTADAFNKMFKKSVADGEDEADELMETIRQGDMGQEQSIAALDETQTKSATILNDMKSIMEDAASDQFFTDNLASDRQAVFREELLDRLDTFANLMEEQTDAIEDGNKGGGIAAAVPIPLGGKPSFSNSQRKGGRLPFGALGAGAGLGSLAGSVGGRLGTAAGKVSGAAKAGKDKLTKGGPGKLLAGFGILAGLSGVVQAIEKVGEMDVAEVEKRGGFFQSVLLTTMDNLTGGITTKLGEGLKELIATNKIAEAITDPIFGAIHGIATFVGDMMDAPMETLKDTGNRLKGFFASIYDDHLKDPLEATFNRVGSFISKIWYDHVVHPFKFAMKQIRKFIDKINPFTKTDEEKTFSRLTDAGILTDNTGLDPRNSRVNFAALQKQALTTDELRHIRNELGGDLTQDQESRLSALILKSSNKPNSRENIERMPRADDASDSQRIKEGLDGVTKALMNNSGGTTIASTAPQKDSLRVHNDNATIDVVNLAVQ